MNDETFLDMEDIDGVTLDDVEEAPDFLVPPSGEYMHGIHSTKVSTVDDEDGKRTSIRIIYFVDDTIEVTGDEDPVPNGSLFSENFQWPKGAPYFKNRMKKLLGDISGVTVKDMLQYLESQYGPEGSKRIHTVQKKMITKSKDGQNEYENVRFVKMDTSES